MQRSAKRARSTKRQLGQFMTPPAVAHRVLAPALAARPRALLEPSFGEGAFLMGIIGALMSEGSGSRSARLGRILNERLWGVELDASLHERALARIEAAFGPLPAEHNLSCGDYFRFEAPRAGFDAIVGNPPFGGTFDADIEDALDRRFGAHGGHKLKKETYAFFVAKALGELAEGGRLDLICSDTFLTIKTMAGLRLLLLDSGACEVEALEGFSEETSYGMVVLRLRSGPPAQEALVLGQEVPRASMEATGSLSWLVRPEHARLFAGPKVGDFLVATGGMTIGRNELFVRPVKDGRVSEPYDIALAEEPVTVAGEEARARLGRLSARRRAEVEAQERAGATRAAVSFSRRAEPLVVSLPHPDYRPYNKASSSRIYAPPSHVVFWRNEGEAVLAFKRSGPWYLHGVGGARFFGREGLTWQLVAPRLNARHLPEGLILDSGAPCAFLREGQDEDELWLVLGWLQVPLATEVLKGTINHTRNIQGKDVERLPYPWWAPDGHKRRVVAIVKDAVHALERGEEVDREGLQSELEVLLAVPEGLGDEG
jgi:hypothetical protein